MTSCNYTRPQDHGIVAPTGQTYLPIQVAGNVPDYKRLNDRPVVKSCEIPLKIRGVSLQVSHFEPLQWACN